jgi:hypothetical protein
MNKVQEGVARSLAAHRGDYPEARLALDSLAADLADVVSVADDDIPAFMTAAASGTTPEPQADRAVPQDVLDQLAAAEAALHGRLVRRRTRRTLRPRRVPAGTVRAGGCLRQVRHPLRVGRHQSARAVRRVRRHGREALRLTPGPDAAHVTSARPEKRR